jgi:hypothetical protein
VSRSDDAGASSVAMTGGVRSHVAEIAASMLACISSISLSSRRW